MLACYICYQYQDKILNTSVQDRKKQGVCWYPVQIQSHKTGTGDRIIIQVEKPIEDELNYVFQVGSVVSLFHNVSLQERANYTGGVVSYIRKNVMKIVVGSIRISGRKVFGVLELSLVWQQLLLEE